MPTFEKSKGLKCQFENSDVTNAVKDVMHHHPSLREAGRRRNVNFCAQSRYLKQANTGRQRFHYCQKDHKNQTCIGVFLVDFTNVCSLKTLLELLIISDTAHVSLVAPGMSLIH